MQCLSYSFLDMGEYKQIERLIRILQRLAIKGQVTVEELYRYFEGRVPKRTLQRDLVELSAADVPLRSEEAKGRRLVWTIDPGYLRFVPNLLRSREVAAVSVLRQFSGLFAGTPLETDANDFLRKARQLYPSDVVDELKDDSMPPIFGMTFTGYIDYRPFALLIDRLIEAIVGRLEVRLTYKPHWKEKQSEFDGHPYLLLLHKGALYAVAYLPYHDNFVFLPVQRLRDVVITESVFTRKKDFDLDRLREGRFGIFGYEGQKPQRVVLRFKPEIADTVAERIWHPTQKLKRHRNGSLTLEMNVIISDELRSWIAGWLEYVTIVTPRYLEIKTGE